MTPRRSVAAARRRTRKLRASPIEESRAAAGGVAPGIEVLHSMALLRSTQRAPGGGGVAPGVESGLRYLQQRLGNQAVRRLLAHPDGQAPRSGPAQVQRALAAETVTDGPTRLRSSLSDGGVDTTWRLKLPRLATGTSVSVDWARVDTSRRWVWAESAAGNGWLRTSKVRRAGDIAKRQEKSAEVADVYTSVAFLQGKLTLEQLMSTVRLLDDDEFNRTFIAIKGGSSPNPTELRRLEVSARACEGFQLDQKGGQKNILVRKTATAAVVLHESLHYVSSTKIQQDAGDLANEGATEFFRMHSVAKGEAMYQDVKANYKKGYDVFEALSGLVGMKSLQGAYFDGNVGPIQNAINGAVDKGLLNRRFFDAEGHADALKPEADLARTGALTGYRFWCALMKMEKTDEAISLLSGNLSPAAMGAVLGPPGIGARDEYPAAPPMTVAGTP